MVAGDPVLDFVNTLDWRFRSTGPEELLKGYGDLLRFAEQAGLLLANGRRRLLRATGERAAERAVTSGRALREALAAVLYAAVEGRIAQAATSLRTLEPWLQEARSQQRLGREGARMAWGWAGREESAELPVWMLASLAGELLTGAGLERVRDCGNDECRWLFLDGSKNGTRRWCDMTVCGNLMKARRFRAQRAE